MSNFLKFLRDPVWQSIGVLVGVVAIFVSIAPSTKPSGNFSVIHWKKENFIDKWLPSNSVQLLIQGNKQELDNSVIDYYLINNSTDKPILISDYSSPLEIKKGVATNKILVVESCSKPFAEQCSSDGASKAKGDYVPFEWKEKGGKWIASPSLLNPGDSSCVVVVSDAKDKNTVSGIKRFEWNARVTNVHLKVYDSSNEFEEQKKQKKLFDYINTSIKLEGVGVYWFVLLQCVFFATTTVLLIKAKRITEFRFKDLNYTIASMLLASSSSEIFVDIFISGSESLHVIVWPLLIFHGLFIAYFSYQALANSNTFSKPL